MSHKIQCPHCQTAFTIDEAGYADIQNQVRTQEFEREINKRVAQLQEKFNSDLTLANTRAQQDFQAALSQKEQEIVQLNAKIQNHEADSRLAVVQAEEILKQKLADCERELAQLRAQSEAKLLQKDSENQLRLLEQTNAQQQQVLMLQNQVAMQEKEFALERQNLLQNHAIALKLKDDEIELHKNYKAKLSTKMLGESLEQHCEIEFNRIRAAAFPRAQFGKDNDASSGSKGDYIDKEIKIRYTTK
ncbi:DUF2130 domain-containing protein [Wielerella bovis]|uniref:DUF2130 domain-containing protein n=1 Tax=Wielerella bovis TaxID=2917790 RepID=UPI002018A331|nr:DUF2130 domain-containing protein [Wielerella bovis]ULJ64776.1 DUF2130 domain-containing protein [Wielerella bovis]ULJ67048.1 DUF2130 domain-containing protein [Wielerella bovis]